MSNIDLPEPKRVPLSAEEEKERHWNLISTFMVFVTGYAIIHKLLIPFSLKFTHVTKTPYSKIDPFFIHPVLLSYFLAKEKRNTPLISLLSGFGIVYGIAEVVHTFQGHYEGWLAVSRLLSSIPIGLGCIYIMTQSSSGRRMSFAWVGAMVGMLSFFWPTQIGKPEVAASIQDEKVEEMREVSPVNVECGNSQLTVDLNQEYVETNEIVIADDCGLKPAVVRASVSNLKIINKTKTATNIHLMVFDKDKQSSRWNIMVPGESTVTSPQIPSGEMEAGFLYSDNSPLVGVTAIVFSKEKINKRFLVSRSPLRMRVVP